MAKFIDYDWSIGWNTQGNNNNAGGNQIFDLSILHKRCQANGIKSIVKLGGKGLPNIIGKQHIDLLNVYSKAMVKGGMYTSYRTNGLDEVSKALLGYGKYQDYSGEDFNSLPIEEAEKYSLRDSQLPMDLSKYRNFEALDAMLAIADITELDFERVCRTNLTTWWAAVFDKTVSKHLRPDTNRFKGRYKGADVLDPRKGFYYNIVVVDGKSLYPSVAINFNISFDTISTCATCKNIKINQIFPAEFTKDFKFVKPDEDWLCRCKDKQGFFPKHLEGFKAERLKQKELGNKAKQHALKILINGGYGAFGSRDYTYYDPRVAELVTAAGRYILSKMQDVAKKEYGFEIIYGDTDSLFLHKTTDEALKEFQKRFNAEYDIELEIKNRYDKLLLSAGKKHYVGYENGEIDTVGFEGEKSDRPEFFHKVYNQLVDDIIKKEIDPLPNLRKAMAELESKQASPKLLRISKILSQNPEDYKSQTCQPAEIGKALGAKAGDLIEYYSCSKKKTGKSWTLDYAESDISHYKELLWNTISEILEIAGYPVGELTQEFGIKVKKKHAKNNSIDVDKTNTGGGL